MNELEGLTGADLVAQVKARHVARLISNHVQELLSDPSCLEAVGKSESPAEGYFIVASQLLAIGIGSVAENPTNKKKKQERKPCKGKRGNTSKKRSSRR